MTAAAHPKAAKAAHPKAAKADEVDKLSDDRLPIEEDVVIRTEDGATIQQQGSQTVARDSGDAIGGAEITGRQLARDEVLGRGRSGPAGRGNPGLEPDAVGDES